MCVSGFKSGKTLGIAEEDSGLYILKTPITSLNILNGKNSTS